MLVGREGSKSFLADQFFTSIDVRLKAQSLVLGSSIDGGRPSEIRGSSGSSPLNH